MGVCLGTVELGVQECRIHVRIDCVVVIACFECGIPGVLSNEHIITLFHVSSRCNR